MKLPMAKAPTEGPITHPPIQGGPSAEPSRGCLPMGSERSDRATRVPLHGPKLLRERIVAH
eukprot:5264462-Alexandrium_andersonii.AAC.1